MLRAHPAPLVLIDFELLADARNVHTRTLPPNCSVFVPAADMCVPEEEEQEEKDAAGFAASIAPKADGADQKDSGGRLATSPASTT